jgi:hypothetical protein
LPLQLFGLDRRLRASIFLGAALAAVAFLNDSGDLLVAPAGAGTAAGAAGPAGAAGALLLVRADSYAGERGWQWCRQSWGVRHCLHGCTTCSTLLQAWALFHHLALLYAVIPCTHIPACAFLLLWVLLL